MPRPRVLADWPEAMLRAMPGTMKELEIRLGLPAPTIRTWANQLRKIGWAHVPKWKRSPGPGRPQPIIHAGPGRTAREPTPFTPAEMKQRWEAKARLTGDYDFVLAKQRARQRARRVIARGKPATPFDALLS